MAAFVLDIKDIDVSGLHKTFEIDSAWLRGAMADDDLRVAEAASPGRLVVSVQRTGEDILVQGHVTTEILATCARCLTDVPLGIDVRLTQLLSPVSQRPAFADELELAEEDLDREYFSGEKIVLDDAVREHVLLEIPMQVRCPEPPGCELIEIPEGVRPPSEFGRDEEVDPRLAPLLNLKRKLENNEE